MRWFAAAQLAFGFALLGPATSYAEPGARVVAVWSELGEPAAAGNEVGARLSALVRELAAAPGLEVVEESSGGGLLLASDAGRQALRNIASQASAEWLVVASHTSVADRHSLDVEVVSAEGRSVLHAALEGRGTGGLASAVAEAARRAGLAIASARERLAEPEAGAEAALLGEAADPGRHVVSEVRVEGNRRIEADAIRGVLATRAGEPLDSRRVAEDVRRVYDLGFFRDVRVTAEDAPAGPIVVVRVQENPIIRQVAISGNEGIDSEDIKEALTLTAGSTIDYPLLIENQQRIEALYQAKGYHLAKANYSVESLAENAVAVNFEVAEGEKLRLVEVDFVGNEHFSDGDLLKGLETKPWRWYSFVSQYWDKSGLYADPLFGQDMNSIQRKYMDAGYIRVKLGDPEVTTGEDGLRVRVVVEEGNRYRVGSLEVAGDDSIDTDELRSLVGLKTGDVFSRSGLSADVDKLQGFYADRGYYFAKVTPRTRVNPEDLTVDCAFEVEKGELVFIDRIEVAGNQRTRDDVVRRELSFVEGGLYSRLAVERSRARVHRLGFFEEVTIEPKPRDDAGRLGLGVNVVERSTGSFSFGAGFGSTDGFLVNGAIRQDNLLGKGWGLNASVDMGSSSQAAYFRFFNPYLWGSLFSGSTTLSMTDREYVDFDQQVQGLDFTLGYPLDEGETKAYSSYQFTDRQIDDFESQAASLIQREAEQEKTTTSLISLSARRDTRDDIRFPRKGQVTAGSVEWAGLGGWSNFVRAEARTTWWFPLKKWVGWDWTFMANTRVGYALPMNSIGDYDLPGCGGDPLSNLDCAGFTSNVLPGQSAGLADIDEDLELPLSERYFLGGIGAFPVRGFKARSLGPRRGILTSQANFTNPADRAYFPTGTSQVNPGQCDYGPGQCNDIDDEDIDDFENLDLTDVIGGNKMALLNLELQFPISEEFGLNGILFFDMGNAFAETESMNIADLRLGTGAGAQWFSPFGPIVVYLGFPLDRLEDEDSSVFEFSFGGSPY
jgi:outer membrane protein insertion porin family